MSKQEAASKPSPVSHIFINRIDTYFGRILAQHLGHCLISVIPDKNAIQEPTPPSPVDLTSDFFLYESAPEGSYQITGTWRELYPPANCCTVESSSIKAPLVPAVKSLVRHDNSHKILQALNAADVIILHSLDDDDNHLLADCLDILDKIIHLPKLKPLHTKSVILVSTAMTWAKTKPNEQEENQDPNPMRIQVDKEDPESKLELEEEEEEVEGLTEENFKRRKCHPKYRTHMQLEQEILRLGRKSQSRIISTVLATGLLFGCGENILHSFFRQAWEFPNKNVDFPANGKNRVPMIHVRDLCQVVQSICENNTPGYLPRYILAVDGALPPLHKVIKAISNELGTGEVTPQPREFFTFLRSHLDFLTSDIRLSTGCVKDKMIFQWIAGGGFVENAAKVVEEYRRFRILTPMKVLVIGKPFVGKTYLSQKLSEWYQLPYINTNQVVKDAMDKLKQVRDSISPKGSAEEAAAESNFDDDELSPAQQAQQLLDAIEESRGENGALAEKYINQFVQEKLLTKECHNKGFVLDGYPMSYAQAVALFASPEQVDNDYTMIPQDESEKNSRASPISFDRNIIPEYVLMLDVSENLLQLRVMGRSELFAVDSHDTSTRTLEQEFTARMEAYKALSASPNNDILDYFDEAEIPVIILDTEKDPDARMEISLQTALTRIGPPHNYGPNEAERRKAALDEEIAAFKKKREAELIQIQQVAEKELQDRSANCKKWAVLLDMHRKHAAQNLKVGAGIIGAYLEKHVLSAVQEGLVALANARPADPIDFLAEFLLQKRNPLVIHGELDPDVKLQLVTKHT